MFLHLSKDTQMWKWHTSMRKPRLKKSLSVYQANSDENSRKPLTNWSQSERLLSHHKTIPKSVRFRTSKKPRLHLWKQIQYRSRLLSTKLSSCRWETSLSRSLTKSSTRSTRKISRVERASYRMTLKRCLSLGHRVESSIWVKTSLHTKSSAT